MTKPETKITTIAGVYADMHAACFAGKPITPAQEKLYKNLFYAGALGMFNLIEDIGNTVSDEDEGAARIAALRKVLRMASRRLGSRTGADDLSARKQIRSRSFNTDLISGSASTSVPSLNSLISLPFSSTT